MRPATKAAVEPPLRATGGVPPEAVKAVPLRHPWRWIAAIVVLGVAAQVIGTIVTAKGLDWSVVVKYLFHPRILQGALLTLELTAGAMAMGIGLGVVLAVM